MKPERGDKKRGVNEYGSFGTFGFMSYYISVCEEGISMGYQ